MISQVEVFWVVSSSSVVVGHQRFIGPCCLHLQGESGNFLGCETVWMAATSPCYLLAQFDVFINAYELSVS
jgi:hypothetical protein